jgi:hypothetical protein
MSTTSEVWQLLRDLVAEQRRGRQPMPVTYLACDGCGNVTAHLVEQRIYSLAPDGMTGTPSEAVCDVCDHAQPRVHGDQVPADTTVTCTGRRFRRIGLRRGRRRCAQPFTVPAAATQVVCPWCCWRQPGPAATG